MEPPVRTNATWSALRWAPAALTALAVVVAVVVQVALWPLLGLLPLAAVVTWAVSRSPAVVPAVSDDVGRRQIEWYGLLAVEYARTPAERRLALASEFLRLAGDLLRLPPTNRHRWHGSRRLNELRRQANLLLGSAVDPAPPVSLNLDPDDGPSAVDLRRALTCLSRYAGLLAALAASSQWDAETMRLVTRERTRLDLARDRIARALTAPRLPVPAGPSPARPLPDPHRDRPVDGPADRDPGAPPAADDGYPPPHDVDLAAPADQAC